MHIDKVEQTLCDDELMSFVGSSSRKVIEIRFTEICRVHNCDQPIRRRRDLRL